jgi:hypothetical protein
MGSALFVRFLINLLHIIQSFVCFLPFGNYLQVTGAVYILEGEKKLAFILTPPHEYNNESNATIFTLCLLLDT